MYLDKVGRVLNLGDLKDEDSDSDNNGEGEGKGGTMTTPLTAKNATRKEKNKLATTTAAKKNRNKKKPPPPCWVVVSDHRPGRLLRYFECNDVG